MKIQDISTHKTPENQDFNELGTIADAQEICGGESVSGIYRAIRRGELIAVKRGNRTLIDLESARRRARNFPRIVVKIAGEE